MDNDAPVAKDNLPDNPLDDSGPRGVQTPSKAALYVLLLIALYIGVRLIGPYWDVVAFAVVTVILTRPLYLLYMRLLHNRQGLAIPLTLVTIVLFILVPSWIILTMTVWQARELSADIAAWSVSQHATLDTLMADVNRWLARIPLIDVQITGAQVSRTLYGLVSSFAGWLASQVVSLTGSVAMVITKVILYLAAVSTLFPAWPALMGGIRTLSPLDNELDQRYIDRLSIGVVGMTRANVISILLQGLTMTLWLALAGIPYLFFWFLICTAMSVLPIGCSVIAFPAGGYLLLTGHTWQGLIVILGYVLVTANLTSLTNTFLFPKGAEVNSTLVLFGLFGGVALVGLQGVCYGPLLMVFLVTTVEILLQHFGANAAPPLPASTASEEE